MKKWLGNAYIQNKIAMPAEQAAPARDEDRSFYRILFGVRTGLAVLSNLLFSFPAGRINFPFDWIAMLVGLFVPKKWVWGLTVGLEGFNILSGLLALLHLLHGDGIGVVILLQAVVMMAFLFTRKVKAYFGMSENEE